MKHLEITHAGEQLTLFAEKALYWSGTKTLIIADPHFGKAAAFRHAGLAVPEHVTLSDLKRLDGLLEITSSKRLLILGDFFHAKTGRADVTMQTLGSWCGDHPQLEVSLVPGNHDRSAGAPPECWNIRTFNELVQPPFTFRHEPTSLRGSCVVGGHLHPCISLGAKFGAGLRAPCFWFRENQVVLPAFGSFTGTHPITADRNDRVFAIEKCEIFPVPASLLK